MAEAKRALEEYLTAHPSDADAWLALGLMAIRSGGLAAGLAALHRVVRLRPMAAEPYRELAAAYRIADDDREADCVRTAEALERDQTIGIAPVLDCLRRGATAEAIESGAEILRRHPSAIRVRYELAVAYQAHNDYDGVVANLGAVVTALPACAPACKALADFLWARDRLAELARSFSAVVLRSGTRSDGPSSLDEVERLYRSAIRHDPEWAEARTYYANVLRAAARLDAALIHYRAAAAQVPEDAVAQFNLAAASAALGDAQTAWNAARRATELRPDSGEAHELLARLACAEGQFTLALAHDSRALSCARFHTTEAFL